MKQQQVVTTSGDHVVFPPKKNRVPALEVPEEPSEDGPHSRQQFYIFDSERSVKPPEVYCEGFLEAGAAFGFAIVGGLIFLFSRLY